MPTDKPQYGIDAPGVIRGFFLTAAVLLAAGWSLLSFASDRPLSGFVGPLLIAVGLASLTFGTAMLAYGRRGKFRVRDVMLNQIPWKGNESVLDIGTGRGLLMIGAAKRLTTGKATGIDIWRAEDLSGNTRENALANAALEGVRDQIELRDEDIRKTTFPDGSFDVILSLLCLHNIEKEAERVAACDEIARLLKPGGMALIADYIPTTGYAKAFAGAGLQVRSSRPYFRQAYGLMWIVAAAKPL